MSTCADDLKKSLEQKKKSLDLTDAELEGLIEDAKDAWKVAQAQVKVDPEKMYWQLLDKQARDRIDNRLIQKKSKLNAIKIQREVTDYVNRYVDTFKTRTRYDAMQALLKGEQSSAFEGGAFASVNQRQLTRTNDFLGLFFGLLDDKGTYGLIKAGAVSDEVTMDALHRMEKGQNLEGVDPHAVQFASAIQQSMELVRQIYALADVDIPKADAYAFRRQYNRFIYSAKGMEWVKGVLNQELDRQAMMEKAPWLADDKKWNDMLEGHFQDTVNGRQLSITGGDTEIYNGKILDADPFKGSAVRGVSRNVLKQYQNGRFFIFKDGAAEARALRQLSDRNLLMAVAERLQSFGREAGLLETFGINYTNNFLTTKAMMADAIRAEDLKTATGRKANKLNRHAEALGTGADAANMLNHLWNNLTGEASRLSPGGELVAKITQDLTSIQSFSKLGHTTPAGVMDIGNNMAELAWSSPDNRISGWTAQMQALAKETDPAIRQQLGFFLSDLEGVLEAHNRYGLTDEYQQKGLLTKINDGFHHVMGASKVADYYRAGTGKYVSNVLGSVTGKPIESLSKNWAARFKLQGITEGDWNLMSKYGVEKSADGRKFLFARKLNDLDTATLKTEMQALRPEDKITDKMADRYRLELQTKINNMVNESMFRGIPLPDAVDRAILHRGTKSGTIGGLANRAGTQFLSFPLAQSRKVFEREFYSRHGATSLLDGRAWARMLTAPHTIAMAANMTIVAYGITTLTNLLLGKEPPDPTRPQTWLAAMAKSGVGTIMSDYLAKAWQNSDGNRGESMAAAFLGPTVSTIDWGANVVHDLAANHDKKSVANAVQFLTNQMPFQNAPFIEWGVKNLFLNNINEWARPGYIDRLQQRAEENGEPYFLPPSATNFN